MTSELLEKENLIPVSAGEDDMRPFLKDIRQFPVLSPEKERLLAQRCAEGDEDAIREMVNSNLRLVVYVAKEYAGRGVPMLDLIQEGCIGLIAAARKFDYTLDYRFSTYATKRIRQRILRYLINQTKLIRVPEFTAVQIRKVEQVAAQLLADTGNAPTPEEIAAKTGFSVKKVRHLLQLNPEIHSIDAPVGENDSGTLGDLLEDDLTPQPQEALVRQELESIINELLEQLNDRQQEILKLHFGMKDGQTYSLEEIGQLLGLSKERVRQIEKQAMEKLQKLGANLGLEDFLNE